MRDGMSEGLEEGRKERCGLEECSGRAMRDGVGEGSRGQEGEMRDGVGDGLEEGKKER